MRKLTIILLSKMMFAVSVGLLVHQHDYGIAAYIGLYAILLYCGDD